MGAKQQEMDHPQGALTSTFNVDPVGWSGSHAVLCWAAFVVEDSRAMRSKTDVLSLNIHTSRKSFSQTVRLLQKLVASTA